MDVQLFTRRILVKVISLRIGDQIFADNEDFAHKIINAARFGEKIVENVVVANLNISRSNADSAHWIILLGNLFAIFASADPSPSEKSPLFVLKIANIELFNPIFFLPVIVLNYFVVQLFDLITVDANDIFGRLSSALFHFLMNLLRERAEHHRIIGRRRHEREILDYLVLI